MNFVCDVCSKVYKTQSLLDRHRREIHHIYKRAKKYECNDCGMCVNKKKDLIEHIILFHGKNGGRLICPVDGCSIVLSNNNCLRLHIVEKHNILLTETTHIFSSKAEFLIWKSSVEKKNHCFYVLNRGTYQKKNENGYTKYYVCNRSYKYSEKIEGCSRKRSIKSSGTVKIGKACLSTMILKSNEGEISVNFIETHIGHNYDLQHIPLSNDVRSSIAGKLLSGIEPSRILRDVRDCAISEITRDDLLERKDIINIKQSLGPIIGRWHNDDSTSVDIWVQYMKQKYNEDTPVLLYKKCGEHCKSSQLADKDFMLVISTTFQRQMLLNFGTSIICVDGTHGMNSYQIQLYTIVTVDEYGNGIPAAYCFTNRNDTVGMALFFHSVKSKIGAIITDTVMTDDTLIFINAWSAVMGAPKRHLLCTWHVNKNWLERLNVIKDPSKRDIVRNALHDLRSELSTEMFNTKLTDFISLTSNDSDVIKFGKYFRQTYAGRAEKWAFCYRQYVGINCNMYLESLHKTIKHFYLQGHKCKRLDSSINALMNLTYDKVFDRLIKLTKNKTSEKKKRIMRSHLKSQTIKSDSILLKNDGHVYIKSKTSDLEYQVKLLSTSCARLLCNLTCDSCRICVHMFKCTCVDNIIYFNICKHIHACAHIFITTDAERKNKTALIQETAQFVEQKTSLDNCEMKTKALVSTFNNMYRQAELSSEQHLKIQKHLNSILDVINEGQMPKLHNVDAVNTNCLLSPQKRFVNKNKIETLKINVDHTYNKNK